MAQRTVTLSDGRTLTLEVSDDATQEDIISTVNQFLESEKPKLPELESQPSLGDIGKGLTAEIAIGESAKLAGTTAGATIGGPIGAIIGYLAGGVGGGISGSLAAQRLEGRTDYSWGRVAADTLLNVIPFAGGKAAKTAKIFPKLGKRALTGAGISAGAAQIEKGIEEQELLSPTELLVAGATGGALNIGIGAAGDALGDIYRKKIAGKNVDAVQKAYDEGDADIIALVDAVTKEGDPNNKLKRFMGAVNSYALPSNLLGKQNSKTIRDAKNKAEAAMDLAGRARKQINDVYKEVDDEGKKAIDRYILGETKNLNLSRSVDPESVNVYHSTDVDFDTFTKRDIGFHFAANADLANNAAKLTGKEGATARPFSIDTTDFVEIKDQGNRFDPYKITEELNQSGRLSNAKADLILDGLDRIEDELDFSNVEEFRNLQGEYFSKAMSEEGIKGFKYMNVYDAYGEASRFTDNPNVLKELQSKGVQPDTSYIVLDNASIQKGHKAIPKPISKKDKKSLTEVKGIIDSARSKIGEYQDTVIDLYDRGILDMNPLTYDKIVKSRRRGDYLTTEYEFFLNKDYQPSKEQTDALLNRLTDDLEKTFRARYKKADVNKKADQLKPAFERRAAFKIRRLLDLRDDPDSINDILKRKEEQTEEMVDFLGLIRDPGERFAGTTMKLGKMAATIDADNKLSNRTVSSGIGVVADNKVEADELLKAGYEPLKIRGKIQENYGRKRVTRKVDKYQDTKTKETYVTKEQALAEGVLPDDIVNIKEEKVLRGGSRVYVPKDFNNAIDLLSRKSFKEDSILWSENLFSQLLSTSTSMAKFVRVPLSVAAYPVQLFGNAMMTAAMGMDPKKNYVRNFSVALSDLNTKKLREGKIAKDLTLKRMTRLKELDLIDRGVLAGDIREGFEKGFLGEVAAKATEPVGKAYSVFDTAQRLTVFDNYKGLLKKVMPEEDFNKLSTDKVEEIASELTNATYQNYGRINPSIRYFSRIGVLNEFAAFNLEQLRTLANQGALIRDMKSGKFAADMKAQYNVNLDQNALDKEASKRLAAGLGMIAAASAGITAINRAKGISKEEEDAIRETVAPFYNEDSKLLIKRDGDKIKLANISYQLPIAELTSVFEAGFRGENPADSVGKAFGALWGKMGGTGTINATNFFAAVSGRDPSTGRPISEEPGAGSQFADRFLFYVGETFTPTLFGKTQDKTIPDLIARYTIGLRNENTTIEKGAGFKFRDVKDNLNNIRRSYSSDLYNKKDMQRSYVSQNAVYQRNLEFLTKQVNNLRTLDKTNDEIDSMMKKAGLSKKIREAALNNEMINMPFGVGISGTRAEKKERAFELYESLPKDVGLYMLNEARDDGRIKQSTINEIIRQSQFKKLAP